MKHIKKMIGSLLFLAISISSCNSQPSQIQTPTDTLPIHIQRFDKALLQFIETQDTALEQDLLKEYPAMLEITGKGILNLQSPAVPGFSINWSATIQNRHSRIYMKMPFRSIRM